MQIEQLKMILDTLSKMGEAGQDAFIWYIVLDKALPVVAWLLISVGILWVIVIAIRAMVRCNERTGEEARFAFEMRSILTPLNDVGGVDTTDRRRMLNTARNLVKK